MALAVTADKGISMHDWPSQQKQAANHFMKPENSFGARGGLEWATG